MMKALLPLLIMFFAIWFGMTWNGVAVSTPNVTAHYDGGITLTGTMHYTWDGAIELTDARGFVHWSPRNNVWLEFHQEPVSGGAFFLKTWRAWVPALFAAIYLVITLLAEIEELRRLLGGKKENSGVGN